MIYWSLKRSFLAMLPFTVYILGYNTLRASISFHPIQEQDGISIISFNVSSLNKKDGHYFDETKDGRFTKPIGENTIEIINYLDLLEQDIICLQEFYNDKNSKYFNTLKSFKERGYNDFFSGYTLGINKAQLGVITLSKYPIINSGKIDFNNSRHNQGIYTDLLVGNDTIRVFNVHFQSLALRSNEIKQGLFRKVIQKYKWVDSQQVLQLKNTLIRIKESPYKVIVCGDLNSTPYEFPYKKFSFELFNGFEKKGNGLGFTLNKGVINFLRIDNIFFENEFQINGFQVIDSVSYSDHFPILSYFEISDE